MRVLIFHGYLLRGTGSNVYNANLAQALARAGHDVHLLCQDLEAASLPWIDAVGTWEGGELQVEGAVPTGGGVTAYLPDIGGLLPTYVADAYEGFESRTFPELSDEELDRLHRRQRRGGRRRRRPRRRNRRRALQSPGDGAGDPRPGRAAVRRQDPRQRALLHGDAPPAVPSVRPRGDGGGEHDPGRIAAHRREPLGDARGRIAPGQDAPRPSRRRRRRLQPAAPTAAEAPAELRALAAELEEGSGRAGRQRRLRARSRGGRDGAAELRGSRGAADRLRRQADRLEGMRPADRGLAAGRPRATRARSCC